MAKTNISRWQSLTKPFTRWRAQRRSSAAEAIIGDVPSSVRVLGTSGVHVDNDKALKVTAFFAGIRLISENIASLPKAIIEATADGPRNIAGNPVLYAINVRPNSYTNAVSFWQSIATWMKGWGNAYAVIKWNASMTAVQLHQVHPSCVRITIVNGRKWYEVKMVNPDLTFLNGIYSDDNMLHFMEMSLDGIKGVNPVLYNAAALGKSIATEQFASEFYEKGGNIKAVLSTPDELGDEAFANFMRHFEASATDHGTPILEYGMKYQQLSVDPVAEHLVQSEVLSVQDVCRILNVPPHMIAELSHATFSNIEHQTIQFVQYSLRPVIKKIEVELENKLFPGEEGKYDVKFKLDGLLRGDTQARSAYYHNAILDGYMSRNEVRLLEGYARLEGLDDMLYPQNEGVVGKEEEETTK